MNTTRHSDPSHKDHVGLSVPGHDSSKYRIDWAWLFYPRLAAIVDESQKLVRPVVQHL
jgi:hypothetical protein